MLPGNAAALEREIVGLGVSEKVKDRARVSFEKSAEQAGFFAHGKNRLVMPAVAVMNDAPPPSMDEKPESKKGGGSGGFGDHDPLLVGLFRKLPPPETEWSEADRHKWLQTAANIFHLVYTGDCGGVVISLARAGRSPDRATIEKRPPTEAAPYPICCFWLSINCTKRRYDRATVA